jgi:hypothetical protein
VSDQNNSDIRVAVRLETQLETLDDVRRLIEKFKFWVQMGDGVIDTALRGEVSEADAVASYATLINTWEPLLTRALTQGAGEGSNGEGR